MKRNITLGQDRPQKVIPICDRICTAESDFWNLEGDFDVLDWLPSDDDHGFIINSDLDQDLPVFDLGDFA